MGMIGGTQQTIISGSVNRGHAPPSVRQTISVSGTNLIIMSF